jgi:hypothetical protein
MSQSIKQSKVRSTAKHKVEHKVKHKKATYKTEQTMKLKQAKDEAE